MKSTRFYITFGTAVTMLLASQVYGYCDTSAKSKRDCELCKVSLQNATLAECESLDVEGPCFWNDSTDINPYAGWTNDECASGGGGPSGGGGGEGGGEFLVFVSMCVYLYLLS